MNRHREKLTQFVNSRNRPVQRDSIFASDYNHNFTACDLQCVVQFGR